MKMATRMAAMQSTANTIINFRKRTGTHIGQQIFLNVRTDIVVRERHNGAKRRTVFALILALHLSYDEAVELIESIDAVDKEAADDLIHLFRSLTDRDR